MGELNDRGSLLDRAWEATRPAELPPAEAERIWLEVARASERPLTLKMEPSKRRGRLTAAALLAFGLAQAAAVVVALMLTVRPDPKHAPKLVAVNSEVTKPADPAPSQATTRHEVEPYETFMLSFNDKGSFVGEERIKPSDPGSTFAYLDVPASNPSDALGILETYAR